MKAKDIATMGISIALLFVTGYVVYFLAKPLVIPGAKFLLMAPMLSFFHVLPLRSRSSWTTIVLLNGGFGALLAYMSPLMSIAIVASGLITAGIYRFLQAFTSQRFAVRWGLSCYGPAALLISFYISLEVTGLKLYGSGWNSLVLLAAIGCLLLGRLGTYAADRYIQRSHGQKP